MSVPELKPRDVDTMMIREFAINAYLLDVLAPKWQSTA